MAGVANSGTICGIGIGTENCYVAVARQGGIEILLNEYSQRSTPAYIAFGGNQREIGVSAKQKQMMNLKNTCFSPTLIIGKKYSEINLNEFPFKIEQGPNDSILIRVNHSGEELILTPIQVLAMLFTKLRQISGNPVDCVINCPNSFDFIQRQALLEAAHVAGLNPLCIVSDMTAVSLFYGFYRTSLTGSDLSLVGFVDCGQTSSQAAIVLFDHKENHLKVLSAEFLSDIGGKHFDQLLANYFIEKHNLKINERAKYRLIAECEKLKKNLSANPNELPINIECLYEEKDFSSKIDRTTFEQLAQNLFDQIGAMLKTTYERALEKYQKEYPGQEFRLDSVEIVGGTSRIPAIKRMIKEFCGMEPSTTLNADEAVARGCALQCAILSPTFRVPRKLTISDTVPYPIIFSYQLPGKEAKNTTLFPKGHPFPFVKLISVPMRVLPMSFDLDFINAKNERVKLAQYIISEPQGSNASQILANDSKVELKIKIKLTDSCLIALPSASIVYEAPKEDAEDEPMEQEKPQESADTQNDPNKMETEQQNEQQQQQQQQQPKKKKVKSITLELLVQQVFLEGYLAKDIKEKFIENELNLILADKNFKEKTDARNALEEFIYEWRDRLENGQYDSFIDPKNKQEFLDCLNETGTWIFDQDEQDILHSKSVYEEKKENMKKKYAEGILFRKREYEYRPNYIEQMGHQLQQARKLVETPEPEEEEQIKKLIEEIEEKQKWFDDVCGKLAAIKTYDNPPFTGFDISHQVQNLQKSMDLIQNNRKRRIEERRKAAEKNAEKAKEEQQQQQQPPQPQAESGDKPANTQDGPMDVDQQQA